jgi:branched-chain amino acid transport system permease protein
VYRSLSLGQLLEPWMTLLVLASLVTMVTLASHFATASLQQTTAMMLVDMILVIGLYTFVGNSGVLSFGHVSFMGIGAYASALLTIPTAIKTAQLPDLPAFLAHSEYSTVPAVLLAALFAALVGCIVALPLVRLSGLPASIATFSLLLVVYTVIKQWRALTAGPSVLGGMPLDTDVISALVWVLLVMCLSFGFQRSRVGRRLRASREDGIAAKAIGVGIVRERVIAFTISAFIVGVGGALYGHLLGSFDPNAFYLQATFLLMVMLVFGGINSLSGAVLGTMAVASVQEILRQMEPGFRIGATTIPPIPNLRELGLGALLVLVLTLRPSGLTGNKELVVPGSRLASRRWFARRSDSPRTMFNQSGVAVATPNSTRKRNSGSQFTDRLVASGLSVRFGGVTALEGIDFSLDRNEIVGLIGPNGAGKTTLINVMTGFQEPTTGSIHLLGQETTGWAGNLLTRAGLSRTFQDVRLFSGLSAFENVAVAGLAIGLSNVEAASQSVELLNWFGIGDKAHYLLMLTLGSSASRAPSQFVPPSFCLTSLQPG